MDKDGFVVVNVVIVVCVVVVDFTCVVTCTAIEKYTSCIHQP